MSALLYGLNLAASHARWVLVGGLFLGLVFQDIAYLAKPSIPVFIGLLLFTACFRIGPARVKGALGQLRSHLVITMICQLLMPASLVLLLLLSNHVSLWMTALLLVLAAAPISGSPNLVIMLGHDPAPALRQLVIGTAALPVTIIPVLLFLPQISDVTGVAIAASKLLMVILVAALFGFSLRLIEKFKSLDASATGAVDGLSAILMALVVVGLMSAIGESWRNSPLILLQTMVFAFAVNFGLQVLGSRFWGRAFGKVYDVPMSVISGNRNIALYLTALPASVTDDLLVFVGCYQFPMYLTPLLLRKFYNRPD